MLVAALIPAALEWSPLAAFVPCRVPYLPIAGVAMLLLGIASVVVLHRWVQRPILSGLLWPLASLLGAALLVRSGWLGWRRGGVIWRGTLYRSDQLRAGRRIDIWRRDRIART